jgi:hypothetical protein
MHEEPEGVLAFPPGQEVPYNPRCWFGFNAGVSKWSPTNVERQANGPPLPGFLLPANRRQAAYKTLAMGEPCGEPLREELWRREGDGWTLSDEAWAVVDEFWMTWPDMEYLLRHECVVLKEVAPPADELAVRAYVLQDGVMHVPCSEVIRLMECLGPDPRGSAVQGQNRSYKVIRLLPDSCLNPSERKAPP